MEKDRGSLVIKPHHLLDIFTRGGESRLQDAYVVLPIIGYMILL